MRWRGWRRTLRRVGAANVGSGTGGAACLRAWLLLSLSEVDLSATPKAAPSAPAAAEGTCDCLCVLLIASECV